MYIILGLRSCRLWPWHRWNYAAKCTQWTFTQQEVTKD